MWVRRKESRKQRESSLVCLNWDETVRVHVCLFRCTWSWTSKCNCLWFYVALLMGALDLLWMMPEVNTFIIQPSINWLSQLLLTWFQQWLRNTSCNPVVAVLVIVVGGCSLMAVNHHRHYNLLSIELHLNCSLEIVLICRFRSTMFFRIP